MKWEYKVIKKAAKEWTDRAQTEPLNELGKEDWELISVVSSSALGTETAYFLIFKRPLKEKRDSVKKKR